MSEPDMSGMSDMQNHLLPEWRREIARLQTENEALRARVAGMKTLADNIELDGSVTPEDVRDMLVEAVNLAWSQNGNNARCTVTANFIGWILLENDRLRTRVAELEAHNKRMWDFICSLDGMNAGHMHDGAIDDEIAIVASDFNALAAAEHSQKPEPDRQD